MTVFNISITKAKTTIAVDSEKDIPDDVYQEALQLGLKTLLNRGASKVTATTYPDEDERKAAALVVAQKQLEMVKTSKIKFTGGKKKSGVSGAVMTEARRLAKGLVKDEMKRQKIKVSHVEASEITKAANALIEEDPSIIEQAKANLAEREKVKIKINVKEMVKVSPALVAKADARKAKGKGKGVSAAQAGKVAPRAKGQAATAH